MKYALRLSVHMLMGGMLFSVLLGRLSLTGFLFGAALGFVLCLFLFPFYRQDTDAASGRSACCFGKGRSDR